MKPTSFFDLEDDDGDDDDEISKISELSKKYWNDEIQDATTDGDDYFSHDIETVDRLALDGETNDHIGSSTNDSFDF